MSPFSLRMKTFELPRVSFQMVLQLSFLRLAHIIRCGCILRPTGGIRCQPAVPFVVIGISPITIRVAGHLQSTLHVISTRAQIQRRAWPGSSVSRFIGASVAQDQQVACVTVQEARKHRVTTWSVCGAWYWQFAKVLFESRRIAHHKVLLNRVDLTSSVHSIAV